MPHSACPRSSRLIACLAASVLSLAFLSSAATADGSGDPKSVSKDENGKYVDAQGNPTFHVSDDGTWDWYTYSGYRRYHSDCHVCHGPDGEGSSYAPALKDSLQKLSYGDFASTVAAAVNPIRSGTRWSALSATSATARSRRAPASRSTGRKISAHMGP